MLLLQKGQLFNGRLMSLPRYSLVNFLIFTLIASKALDSTTKIVITIIILVTIITVIDNQNFAKITLEKFVFENEPWKHLAITKGTAATIIFSSINIANIADIIGNLFLHNFQLMFLLSWMKIKIMIFWEALLGLTIF